MLILENKKAFHDYHVLQTFEAGLVLLGSEVKSLRAKQLTLKDSYVDVRGGEVFLRNLHIAEYKSSHQNNHAPERLRKLLLNRSEIDELIGALQTRGLTCVPLKFYFKDGRAKVLLGLVKGKKQIDKREAIKKRDVQARLRQTMSRNRS